MQKTFLKKSVLNGDTPQEYLQADQTHPIATEITEKQCCDSLTRFQDMSFLFPLHTGNFQQSYSHTTQDHANGGHRCVCAKESTA
jgi:hypothetical protein